MAKTLNIRYEDLPESVIKTVCYFLATKPKSSHKDLQKEIENSLMGVKVPVELIGAIEEHEKDLVLELKKGGAETIFIAQSLGFLPYASLFGRVNLLHELIVLGKDGYFEEITTSTGEIVEIKKHDFRTALDATKQLTGIMERIENASEEDNQVVLVEGYEFVSDPVSARNVENEANKLIA